MTKGSRKSIKGGMFFATALAIAAIVGLPVLAAEEQTVNAFATWDGEGKLFRTGESSATFVGAIAGPLYVESEHGTLAAGEIVCPAVLEIDLSNAKQTGSGKCVITADDGAQTFAEWSCRGVHLVGCDGEIIINGGTERLQGISGRGVVKVRTTARGVQKAAAEQASLTEIGSGLLVLRDLRITFPGAQE